MIISIQNQALQIPTQNKKMLNKKIEQSQNIAIKEN